MPIWSDTGLLEDKFKFIQCSEIYALRSTKELNILEVPRTKCISYGVRAFSASGAHQWNFLPNKSDVKKILLLFKKSLKTLLFK